MISFFQLAHSASCLTDAECANGKCVTATCVCNEGYVTYQNVTCNYKQKEKLTAFLLSFLVGTLGADWFYLASGNGGYIVAGIFKLLTGLFLIASSCFLCCAFICAKADKSSLRTCGIAFTVIIGVLVVLCSLTNAIWYTVDWIRVLANGFKDGNGVSLKEW